MNKLADWQADVEAEAVGDTLSDAHSLVDTLPDLRKYWSTR